MVLKWSQRSSRRLCGLVRGVFSLMLSWALGAWAAEAPKLCVLTGRTMGTTFSVKVVAGSPLQPELDAGKLEIEINKLLEKLNRQMSTYLPDSELSQFNQCGHTNWFPVSLEVMEVFQKARSISESSHGAFDITVGPLVNLWGFGPDKRPWQVPDTSEIIRLLPRVGYRHLAIRASPPSIRKNIPEVYCDLSAIAKGYGVDQVAEYLDSIGTKHYLVQIGGEVRAQGRNESGALWRMGIQDPRNPEKILRSLALSAQSISTSGDYVQSFEQDGRRYSHTIDPRTGRPVTHDVASVTVVHVSSVLADGWATALNALGPEEGFRLALQQQLPISMMLRTPDGLAENMTPEFKNLILDSRSP